MTNSIHRKSKTINFFFFAQPKNVYFNTFSNPYCIVLVRLLHYVANSTVNYKLFGLTPIISLRRRFLIRSNGLDDNVLIRTHFYRFSPAAEPRVVVGHCSFFFFITVSLGNWEISVVFIRRRSYTPIIHEAVCDGIFYKKSCFQSWNRQFLRSDDVIETLPITSHTRVVAL